MARKIVQIIRCGSSTWLARIYTGRNPETWKRRYIGKFIHGGLRPAQTHPNRMLAERDLGRNICSSRRTVRMYSGGRLMFVVSKIEDGLSLYNAVVISIQRRATQVFIYAAPETAFEGFRVGRVRYRAFAEFCGMAASLSYVR